MTNNLLDQTNEDQLQNDPNKNYLEELVGEGKKFKTVEDLARGKYESDTYIPIMEKRFDQMREDYLQLREDSTSRAKLEELIDQLADKQLTSSENNPNANEVNKEIKPALDPKEIESLVSSKIQEHELTKKQQENYDLVRNKLRERFGENYQTTLKDQIARLGLTEDFANDLAKKYPSVFFKTFGLDQEDRGESFQTPPKSNQRSDNFAPKTIKRTWAYYQKMKKESPRQYLDSKTQIQMQRDAIDLGEDFKDGDYHNV